MPSRPVSKASTRSLPSLKWDGLSANFHSRLSLARQRMKPLPPLAVMSLFKARNGVAAAKYSRLAPYCQ
ncbi:hypothetical protein D3C86_1393910 [compost metagenome]